MPFTRVKIYKSFEVTEFRSSLVSLECSYLICIHLIREFKPKGVFTDKCLNLCESEKWYPMQVGPSVDPDLPVLKILVFTFNPSPKKLFFFRLFHTE